MATLYVENVPEELYEALRTYSQAHRKSIAAQVIELIEENIPTKRELARRRQLVRLAAKIRREQPPPRGPFPSAEEMLREDRNR